MCVLDRIRQVGVRWRDDGDSRLDLVAGNWTNLLDILCIRFARYPSPVWQGRLGSEASEWQATNDR